MIRARHAIPGAAIVLSLGAVWASPVLVTTDGPSHLYNAMVRLAVERGRAPYARLLLEESLGLQPNRAAGSLLEWLGRAAGWELGERLLVTIIVVATFGLVMAVARAGELVPAAVAAWLSHNWFLWMGFYDFALSLPCFAVLLLVLRSRPTPRRHVVMQLVLAACYVTHFLTFVVGGALAAAVLTTEVCTGRASRRALYALGPAAAVLLAGLASGVTGGHGMAWDDPWKGIAGLVLGDAVRTFHPLDAIGGTPITLAALAVGVVRLAGVRRTGLRALDPVATVGLALLLLSPLAPGSIGVGGYIPIRLQLLGIIALLPSLAQGAARLRPWVSRVAVAVLLAGFTLHAVRLVGDARMVAGHLDEMGRLFQVAGATPGAWVRTRLATGRAGLFRISGYSHLVDRIALRRGFVVLDDYEALYGVFAVSWQRRPDWLVVRSAPDGGLVLDLVPGDVRWTPALYLLHERLAPIVAADARLLVGPTAATQAFAVTPLIRRFPGDGR